MELELVYEIGSIAAMLVGAYLLGYLKGILTSTNKTNSMLKAMVEE